MSHTPVIKPPLIQLPDINDPPEIEDEEATALSFMDIYNQLLIHGEMILTIPIEEEATLRKGLAGVKAKQNQKLKASNITPDNTVLSFAVTPTKGNVDAIDVHIILAKRTSVTVLGIKLPDNEI